jgi:8-hydroxy-5-deazaflavin:NADPH oxidoreductase
MRVGIIGSGRIGGNIGIQLARSEHEVFFSGSRDARKLEALAAEAPGARAGTPAEAVAFAEALVFAVPWPRIDDVLAQTGSLAGRIVVDTTNQYGASEATRLAGELKLAD